MAGLIQIKGSPQAQFFSDFRRKAREQRVPVSGMLELTSRCNLKCVHCYLGPQEEAHKKRELEMETAKVKLTLDEMAAAGTLYLTITGGDPMMRKDFAEVYIHAKSRGLIVTVYCDGILVTDKIVELFKKYPPYKVEVSIYGATQETYEKVTRVKGSYPHFIAGLNRLAAAGINYALKTVLMTWNEHELGMMRQIADDRGVPFRFDAAIFPCLPSGETKDQPIQLRVRPERVIAAELTDPALVSQLKEFHELRKDNAPTGKLYNCGAGTTGFYINPFGEMSPCIMTTQYQYSLHDSTFGERWEKDVGKLRAKAPRPQVGFDCDKCEIRSLCNGCAAFNYQENGAEDVKSDYQCRMTHLRYEALYGRQANTKMGALVAAERAMEAQITTGATAAGSGATGLATEDDHGHA